MLMFSYILYGFIWLISFLPLRILYLVADLNYLLLYYVVHYRRGVVRTNLCNSFPEKSLREIKVIERKYYKHLADLSIELYKLWHMSEASIRKRCVFKNTELPQSYFNEGRSVIGAVLVAKDDTLRVIARYRSENRLFLAGFIGDQTPNGRNLNFWMRFLNQDTPVLLGTERIARKYNIPVVSVRMRKVKRGYYEVEFVDVCANPSELPQGKLTEMHTRLLESFIQEEPEFWLWSHKRWKHKKKF